MVAFELAGPQCGAAFQKSVWRLTHIRSIRPLATRSPRSRASFKMRSSARKEQVSVTDSAQSSLPTTAPAAIEAGLEAFQTGNPEKAYQLFSRAMELKTSEEEGRAASYNSACALTKLKRYKEAADQILLAVNEYGLKLDVAVKVHHLYYTFNL
jgi:hypothetical protein